MKRRMTTSLPFFSMKLMSTQWTILCTKMVRLVSKEGKVERNGRQSKSKKKTWIVVMDEIFFCCP